MTDAEVAEIVVGEYEHTVVTHDEPVLGHRVWGHTYDATGGTIEWDRKIEDCPALLGVRLEVVLRPKRGSSGGER